MPKIGLANDVTLEYERGFDDEANYKFTTDIPDLGEFAQEGVLFSVQTRKEPEDEDEFLYTFKTKGGVTFQLFEETLGLYIEYGDVTKVDT